MLSTTAPRNAAWAKLAGPDGFRLNPAEPKTGGSFEVVVPSGDRLTGTVEVYLPRQALTGIVHELDDALFRLATWRDAQGKTGVLGVARYLHRGC